MQRSACHAAGLSPEVKQGGQSFAGGICSRQSDNFRNCAKPVNSTQKFQQILYSKIGVSSFSGKETDAAVIDGGRHAPSGCGLKQVQRRACPACRTGTSGAGPVDVPVLSIVGSLMETSHRRRGSGSLCKCRQQAHALRSASTGKLNSLKPAGLGWSMSSHDEEKFP